MKDCLNLATKEKNFIFSWGLFKTHGNMVMDFQLDPGLVRVFQLPMKQIYEIIKNLRRSYLTVVFANHIFLITVVFVFFQFSSVLLKQVVEEIPLDKNHAINHPIVAVKENNQHKIFFQKFLAYCGASWTKHDRAELYGFHLQYYNSRLFDRISTISFILFCFLIAFSWQLKQQW